MAKLILILALVASVMCSVQGAATNVCKTSDEKDGKCIGIRNCPQILDLLKHPIPEDVVSYIRNARCDGTEQHSVCCGPPPNLKEIPSPTTVCSPTATPADPRTGCCGTQTAPDRIIKGNITEIDEYPWVAVIEYMKGDQTKLLCGGTLISGRYVLTTAHCVVGAALKAGTPVNVRLGEYDISNDVKSKDCVEYAGGGLDCADDVVVIPIETIIPHPDYVSSKGDRTNDIALLRLKEMAPYTDFIRPICLPQTDVTASPEPDLRLELSGWSLKSTQNTIHIKQNFDMLYKTKEQCQQAYAKHKVTLSNGQVCAAGELGQDICKVNSGVPLMKRNPKYIEIIGISSFGPSVCGTETIPDIFTKIYEYNSWIQSQIKP